MTATFRQQSHQSYINWKYYWIESETSKKQQKSVCKCIENISKQNYAFRLCEWCCIDKTRRRKKNTFPCFSKRNLQEIIKRDKNKIKRDICFSVLAFREGVFFALLTTPFPTEGKQFIKICKLKNLVEIFGIPTTN